MNDLSFITKEYEDIIQEAGKYAQKDIATKKDFILRVKEKAIIMFKKEGRDLQELSSFLWNELTDYNFTYPYNHWIELFNDNEKRNYSQSYVGNIHKHSFDKHGKCKCGILENKGILYTEYQEPKPKKPKLRNDLIPRRETPFTQYLEVTATNLNELAHLYTSLIDKYSKDKTIADAIEKQLSNIKSLISEQKDVTAELIAVSRQVDYRQRIGKFEKLKAVLLDKCLYNTAKVAKLLQITPKHMSANIIKREFPELHENTRRWFRCVEVKFSQQQIRKLVENLNKEQTIVLDLSQWYDKQYTRGELGLDIKQPFVINYVAQ